MSELDIYNYVWYSLLSLNKNMLRGYKDLQDIRHNVWLHVMQHGINVSKRYIHRTCYWHMINYRSREVIIDPQLPEYQDSMSIFTDFDAYVDQMNFLCYKERQYLHSFSKEGVENRKPVVIEFGDNEISFGSKSDAARYLNVAVSSISRNYGTNKQTKLANLTIHQTTIMNPFVGSNIKVRKTITEETFTDNPVYEQEYEYNTDKGSDENEFYKLMVHKEIPNEGVLIRFKKPKYGK